MSSTTDRLKAFAYVYESGSFDDAAEALGVRAPEVSERIANLSGDHAVTLFTRDENRLEPTPLAHYIYPHAVAIRDAEHAASLILNGVQTYHTGRVRIGIGNAYPGMALVQKLRQMIPKVTVQIETGNWTRIMDLFENEKIDIGFLPDVPPMDAVDRVVCFQQRLVAVLNPRHPLSRSKELSLSQIMSEPVIFRTEGSSTQRMIDKTLEGTELTPTPVVVSDSREGVLEAVAQNLGIGFAWQAGTFGSVDLRRIPITELSDPVPEHIFARSDTSNRLVSLIMSVVTDTHFSVDA